MAHPSLLSLNPDVLRCVAAFLPPTDRVALSHACRTLYKETWAHYGLHDLLSRFPFERRLSFALAPIDPADPGARAVPDRAAQQHVYAAVSDDGRLAAVLAYDNRLRILDPRERRIAYTLHLRNPAMRFDIWDVAAGVRRASPRTHPMRSYADSAALDVELSLAFAPAPMHLLLLACPSYLHLYDINKDDILTRTVAIDAAPTLAMLRTYVNNDYLPATDGVAGAAALSPDGTRIAWIMYAGAPARVYLTIWTIVDGTATCDVHVLLAKLQSPVTNALAWARPVWRGPTLVAVVLNTTLRMLRTERVGDTFRRCKLCRFQFYGVRIPAPRKPGARIPLADPDAKRSSWLSLSPALYPAAIAAYVRAIAAETRGITSKAAALDAEESDDAAVGPVALNTIHTCPAEATYKALSFGEQTRHPWFVAKQPLYSIHFCRRKDAPNSRVLVAAAAHDNAVGALERPPECGMYEPTGPTRDGRRFAFHTLPWRSAFTSVSAFAPSGRWIVGAALDEDTCYVSVRNLTDAEYGGA